MRMKTLGETQLDSLSILTFAGGHLLGCISKCLQHRKNLRHLVEGFLVLGCRIGIIDDPAARPAVYRVLKGAKGANGDTGITLAMHAKVANATAIDGPSMRFETVNNFHCANFRRAGD